MGQATVDLPDPLEDPKGAAAPAPANTDDLLAEMASSQIDQMLAEAELDRPFDAAETTDPNDPAQVAIDAVDAAARQMTALSPADAVRTSPETDQTIEDLDNAAARQLDELFDELQAGDTDALPPGTPAFTPVQVPASVAPPRIEPAPVTAQSSAAPLVSAVPVDPKVDAQLNAL